MYIGFKEKATIMGVALFFCLLFLLFTPWWMAILAFGMLIPLFMQLRRLGPEKTKARRPEPP